MENKIRNIILKLVSRNKQVVYGQQAVNAQLPRDLNRKTNDYDILTNKPEKSANELRDNLNKDLNKTDFVVVPAVHKGTFKVKQGTDTIADYTLARKKPKSINILGVRYANLDSQEKKLKKISKDINSEYRHEKDKDTLNKIEQRTKNNFWGKIW